MSESVQSITFDQMKGAIGSLLLLWSGIERELAYAIRKMNFGEVPKSAQGISRSLDVWSQQVVLRGEHRPLQTQLCNRLVELLREALDVRNLVCHGLRGLSAQGHRCEAHLIVELGEDRRILTWSELQEMLAWMSRTEWLIQDLTFAAVEKDAVQANDRLRCWKDFPHQG